MKTLTLLLTLLVSPVVADICPRCGQDHAVQNVASAQGIAQMRADFMARNHYRSHPPESAGRWSSVGSFEGVGWSSVRNASRNTIPTCTPRRGMQLVADAVAYGAGGSYRVRIWR